MDDSYDVVICGTGLTECILAGLLAQEKKKVLHIDRNPFYGGEGASLNLTAMWKMFRPGVEPPQILGANRDWNIDLIPKFVMANGQLVKILLKTRVSRYLEWKPIDGTYVYQYKQGGFFSKAGAKIDKVPGNASEAVKSDLMSFTQKYKCKSFFEFVQNYEENDPKTHSGLNIKKQPFADLIKKFGLEDNTIDFIGHAVALYTNDQFINSPAQETIERIKLYMDSIGRYGDSPFIYPIYGLGGIPEGFARMCALHGGTFMLNQDIDQMVFDSNGKVCGVGFKGQVAKCSMVICNPSYCVGTQQPQKIKSLGKIIRSICIMDHPIPNTKDLPSIQIIIPQRQTGRKSDLYVMMVSSVHAVCKKGYYVAIISTMLETNNYEQELAPAYEVIGPVLEKFITVSDFYIPVSDFSDNVYISKSMDPQSHFESATQNVLELYKQITGKELDLTNLPEDDEQQ